MSLIFATIIVRLLKIMVASWLFANNGIQPAIVDTNAPWMYATLDSPGVMAYAYPA